MEGKKFPAMNELVFKHGEEAKKAGETLKEYVLETGTEADKELAALLGSDTGGSVKGGICNDENPNTTGDVYIDTNGTCKGTEIVVRNSVKCKGDPVGHEFSVDGVSYLVVDNTTIKNYNNLLRNICTSNVTDMSSLLQYSQWRIYKDFPIDIGDWDVSSVTTMSNMFFQSTNFNQDLNNWDVSNVKDFYGMFYETSNMNPKIEKWNINSEAIFDRLIRSTVRPEENNFQIDLSNWTINSNNSKYSTVGCKSLNLAGETMSPSEYHFAWSSSLINDNENGEIFVEKSKLPKFIGPRNCTIEEYDYIPCDDNNSNTIDDSFLSGICSGY